MLDRCLALAELILTETRVPTGPPSAVGSGYTASDFSSTLGDAENPLRLDLPGSADGSTFRLPSARSLQTLSALYLQAELESTGLLAVAELLAKERGWLPIRSVTAAGKLEEFVNLQRRSYDSEMRQMIFARVFGLGDGAAGDQRLANHAFSQLFASFCQRLLEIERDLRWGQQPGVAALSALQFTSLQLLANLGRREYGNTLQATRTIQTQLNAAIDLVSDPGVAALVQGTDMWDTLSRILDPSIPDFGRFINRGQAGQKLLIWCARHREHLPEAARHSVALISDSQVFIWATTWLQASGFGGRS